LVKGLSLSKVCHPEAKSEVPDYCFKKNNSKKMQSTVPQEVILLKVIVYQISQDKVISLVSLATAFTAVFF